MKLKSILLVAVISLLAISCSPEYGPNSSEQDLIGDWKLNQTITYSYGVAGPPESFSDPVNCHLNLKSSAYNEDYLNVTHGLSCTPVNAYWRLEDGVLNLSGIMYQIISQSSSELVIQYGSTSADLAIKYYLSL